MIQNFLKVYNIRSKIVIFVYFECLKLLTCMLQNIKQNDKLAFNLK
jgi:hypothetical protein